MHNTEPEPLERSFSFQIEMVEVGQLPELLASSFAHCSAEVQMLEHAIKSAITNDVRAFAKASEQISLLKVLEKASLGQAKAIMIGNSSQKEVSACVGFFEFVKMQWGVTKRSEAELTRLLKDACERRYRIAHQLLAEVLHSVVSVENALVYLTQSRQIFFDLRCLIVTADGLSSKMGCVAPDGSSLPRFKTNS